MKGTYGACTGQGSSGESHLLDRGVRWSRPVAFDDSAVEGGTSGWDHVKLEEEKLGATLVLCVVDWQKTETGRSREMDLGPTEASA